MPKGNSGHGGHHGDIGGGDTLSSTSYYTFTFSSDNASVNSMARVNTTSTGSTNSKALDVSSDTFATTVGTNDLGTQSVVSVEQTHADTRSSDLRVYNDQDGDSHYSETFDLHVAVSSDNHLRQHQLTFNSDGSIATDAVLCRNTWQNDAISSTEVYTQVTLGSDTYVVKTESTTTGYNFAILRDDNGDGVWTEVAGGHSTGTYIDATTGTLNLVGIQTYLAAADGITG